MAKRKIVMIGNSHIDPIWLWRRAEGMQEVKATFASALQRMEEFPEFVFTMSSGAFLEWLRDNCPALFQQVRRRVAEGRWEIVGGMWIEPDCNLPGGEALIRQFLYAKAFIQAEFGVEATVGYGVDSFGHGPNLPAILRGCGMHSYLASRPSKAAIALPPVFAWRAPNGSTVKAERTGGEYLAWTRPAIEFNLKESEDALDEHGQNHMAVLYGVGNHGGGPTIDNIKSVREIQAERTDLDIRFGTLAEFFAGVDEASLPVVEGQLGPIFTGCYSSDNEIKRLNRAAEWALHKAEAIHAMAAAFGADGTGFDKDLLARAWKELLFNQFHDALSGTCIEPARDEVCASMQFALAAATRLADDGIQRLAARIDTRGDGFPLLLVNPTGTTFHGVVQAEVYCPGAPRKQLRLRGTQGQEILAVATAYRAHSPDSRLAFLFEADIPPMGWAVYRVLQEGPAVPPPAPALTAEGLVMDNGVLRAEFDEGTGCPRSLKLGTTELLAAPARFMLQTDDRGAWGVQDLPWEEDGAFALTQARVLECSPLRAILQTVLTHGCSTLVLDWILEKDADTLAVNAVYHNHEQHAQVCLALPLAGSGHSAVGETAFLAQPLAANGKECCQHRFADIRAKNGSGLAVLNSSTYCMRMQGNEYRLVLSRSVMFARMGDGGPLPPDAARRYMDQGEWAFRLALVPHAAPLPAAELFARADRFALPPEQLYDCLHTGAHTARTGTAALPQCEGAVLSAMKPAADGGDIVLRLFEANGKEGECKVRLAGGRAWQGSLAPYEIKTLRWGAKGVTECDMLERPLA